MPYIFKKPDSVKFSRFGILSWGNSINQGRQSLDGTTIQTYSTPLGVLRFSATISLTQDDEAVKARGVITRSFNGLNAMVMRKMNWENTLSTQTHIDDIISFNDGVLFADGVGFSDGISVRENVETAAASGATQVTISTDNWGEDLQVGDIFGFNNHYGWYQVINVVSSGTVDIFPPLRASIGLDNQAVVDPNIALRVTKIDDSYATAMPAIQEPIGVILEEIPHSSIVSNYAWWDS